MEFLFSAVYLVFGNLGEVRVSPGGSSGFLAHGDNTRRPHEALQNRGDRELHREVSESPSDPPVIPPKKPGAGQRPPGWLTRELCVETP